MKSKNRIQNPDLYVINCMQFSECKPPLARQLSLIHYDSNVSLNLPLSPPFVQKLVVVVVVRS